MGEIRRMVLVPTSRDRKHIPDEWAEYPVIVEPLLPFGEIYLIDDAEILEQLERDRKRLGFGERRHS